MKKLLTLLSCLLLIGCEEKQPAEPPLTDAELVRELCSACIDRDLERAASAIRDGADVNTLECGGYNSDTPLLLAVHNRSKEIVELLIENGADVNLTLLGSEYHYLRGGTNALDFALQNNFSKIAAILREHGGQTKFSDEQIKGFAENYPNGRRR